MNLTVNLDYGSEVETHKNENLKRKQIPMQLGISGC